MLHPNLRGRLLGLKLLNLRQTNIKLSAKDQTFEAYELFNLDFWLDKKEILLFTPFMNNIVAIA